MIDKGKLIYILKRPNNLYKVEEANRCRWLSLNDRIQSLMSLDLPHAVIWPHLHALLMPLHWGHKPTNMLELGLGGGSLQRFMHNYQPECEVTTIENDQHVIDICREHFELPANLKLIREDAADFVQQSTELWDWIVVDLCDALGNPELMLRESFYQSLKSRLSTHGLISVNALTEEAAQHIARLLKPLFNEVCTIDIQGMNNKVILAGETLKREKAALQAGLLPPEAEYFTLNL